MKLNTGYTKWGVRVGLACTLLGALLLPMPAGALSFFKPKKPPVENLPPDLEALPTLKPPALPTPSDSAPPTVPESVLPGSQESVAPTVAMPVAIPLSSVERLVRQGIYPPGSEARTEPFTRAELASILVKAIGYNTQLISEFPFFRDVPTDYWAYAEIETAREKRLMADAEDGFYQPERRVTYADVYRAMANAVTGPFPSEEVAEQLLGMLPDAEELPESLRLPVAKLTQARFFSEKSQLPLQPDALVTPDGLAPLMTALLYRMERRTVLAKEGETLPLPGNLPLVVTPASAIYETQLTLGNTVSFSLVNAVDPLPKESTVRGVVREVTAPRTYVVELDEVRTPEDVFYRTRALVRIVFPEKEKLPFIVPGETFDAVTETLPESIPVAPPAEVVPVEIMPAP